MPNRLPPLFALLLAAAAAAPAGAFERASCDAPQHARANRSR